MAVSSTLARPPSHHSRLATVQRLATATEGKCDVQHDRLELWGARHPVQHSHAGCRRSHNLHTDIPPCLDLLRRNEQTRSIGHNSHAAEAVCRLATRCPASPHCLRLHATTARLVAPTHHATPRYHCAAGRSHVTTMPPHRSHSCTRLVQLSDWFVAAVSRVSGHHQGASSLLPRSS